MHLKNKPQQALAVSVTVGERELTGAVGRVREAWRARCEKKKKQRGNKPGGRGVSCRQVRCRALPGKGVDRGKELWYSNPCNKNIAEWSSPVARRAHNPKVVGSNPASATTKKAAVRQDGCFFCALPGRGKEERDRAQERALRGGGLRGTENWCRFPLEKSAQKRI